MKPLTREWVELAEEDYHAALREIRARKHPSFRTGCFLAQQCVEKYLKALMIETDISFRRTHDLEELLNQVVPIEPLLESYRTRLQQLTSFAVTVRYPGGEPVDKPIAVQMIAVARSVRRQIRTSLGIDEDS